MEICEKLKRVDGAMTFERYQKIFDAFLNALSDYSVDNRGDVGSWIRESAIIALINLTLLLSRKQNEKQNESLLFTQKNCEDLFCGLMKQSLEKIDRVRSIAGSCIAFLLYSNEVEIMTRAKASLALRSRQKVAWDQINTAAYGEKLQPWNPIEIPFIPNRDEFMNAIPKNDCLHMFSPWTHDLIFSRLIPFMKFKLFQIPILSGLCSSVGGLSKKVVSTLC